MMVALQKSGGSFYHSIISCFSGKYNHSELIFDKLDIKKYWFGCDVKEGPRFTNIVPYPRNWDIFKLNIKKEQEQVVYRWCKSQVGCKYDFFEIIRFFNPFEYPSENNWGSTELCVSALQEIMLFNWTVPCHTSPNNFYDLIIRSSLLA